MDLFVACLRYSRLNRTSIRLRVKILLHVSIDKACIFRNAQLFGIFFFLLVCNSKVFKTILNGNFKGREIESNMRRGLFALVTLEK